MTKEREKERKRERATKSVSWFFLVYNDLLKQCVCVYV